MPALNDYIKTSFRSELGGQPMVNTLFWQITDLGDDPTSLAALQALTVLYWDAIKDLLVIPTSLTCAVLQNLSQNEGSIIDFPVGLVGTDIGTPHPSKQVARISLTAQATPAHPLSYGAYNLSGIPESQSSEGRWNNKGFFLTAINFMKDEVTIGTGWTVIPVLEVTTLKGFQIGSNQSANLTTEPGSFVDSTLIGKQIVNRNDRSKGTITGNTTSSVTAALAGGKDNVWDIGDQYGISPVDPFWTAIVQAELNTGCKTLRSRTTALCAPVA
jgi:hypothetical protein